MSRTEYDVGIVTMTT